MPQQEYHNSFISRRVSYGYRRKCVLVIPRRFVVTCGDATIGDRSPCEYAAGLVWRRAAPTLRIRDPNKEDKMAAINLALASCNAEHPVFYEDEVDN